MKTTCDVTVPYLQCVMLCKSYHCFATALLRLTTTVLELHYISIRDGLTALRSRFAFHVMIARARKPHRRTASPKARHDDEP
jgi:hypothetical protein